MQYYYLNFTIGDDSIDSNTGAQAASYANVLEETLSTGLVGQALT